MENFSIQDRVREQYNRAPYPQINWLASCPQSSIAHSTYETGAALVKNRRESHRKKRLALLGCGTFEPYALGAWQKGASIDAVDLSLRTLSRARWRCRLHLVNNVQFHESDLIEFSAKNKELYDYIHCYGVLHHLPEPQKGFVALAQALKPDGFARIMVYSKASRRKPQLIQKAATLLGLQKNHDWALMDKFMDLLPWSHPLKLAYAFNPDNASPSGIVDSALHACENSFSIDDLLETLDSSGLILSAWDFSQNTLNLLQDQRENDLQLLQRLRYLEAFDQWPAAYTFWVQKKGAAVLKPGAPMIYAAIPPPPLWQRRVDSTVLRRSVKITAGHLRLWRRCYKAPQNKDLVSKNPLSSESVAMTELLKARFLLEVKS